MDTDVYYLKYFILKMLAETKNYWEKEDKSFKIRQFGHLNHIDMDRFHVGSRYLLKLKSSKTILRMDHWLYSL